MTERPDEYPTSRAGSDDPIDRLTELGRSMALQPPTPPTTRGGLGRRVRVRRRRRIAAFGGVGGAALLVGVLALPGLGGDGGDRRLDVTGPTVGTSPPDAAAPCSQEFWHPNADAAVHLVPDAAGGVEALASVIEGSGDAEVVHRVSQVEAHRRFVLQFEGSPELVAAVDPADLPPSLEVDLGADAGGGDAAVETWAARPDVVAVTTRGGPCGLPLFEGLLDDAPTTSTTSVVPPEVAAHTVVPAGARDAPPGQAPTPIAAAIALHVEGEPASRVVLAWDGTCDASASRVELTPVGPTVEVRLVVAPDSTEGCPDDLEGIWQLAVDLPEPLRGRPLVAVDPDGERTPIEVVYADDVVEVWSGPEDGADRPVSARLHTTDPGSSAVTRLETDIAGAYDPRCRPPLQVTVIRWTWADGATGQAVASSVGTPAPCEPLPDEAPDWGWMLPAGGLAHLPGLLGRP